MPRAEVKRKETPKTLKTIGPSPICAQVQIFLKNSYKREY